MKKETAIQEEGKNKKKKEETERRRELDVDEPSEPNPNKERNLIVQQQLDSSSQRRNKEICCRHFSQMKSEKERGSDSGTHVKEEES